MTVLRTFVEHAHARLLQQPPVVWSRSDDDMNANARMIADGVEAKAAAVLVGLFDRDGKTHVLLTQRKATLSKHAGQIAFPGGRVDAGETAVQAALREAHEETGLAPHFVRPIGFLDGYLTVTGYFIVPVVAEILPGPNLTPHADEVEDIFDVPLSFILDGKNRQTHSREWNGMSRHYYVYPFGERYIWGATAGMLKNLADRMADADA